MGGENLDAIDISAPNVIHSFVIEDFKYLVNQLGYPMVILDEDEWINIIDATIEKTEFTG